MQWLQPKINTINMKGHSSLSMNQKVALDFEIFLGFHFILLAINLTKYTDGNGDGIIFRSWICASSLLFQIWNIKNSIRWSFFSTAIKKNLYHIGCWSERSTLYLSQYNYVRRLIRTFNNISGPIYQNYVIL